MQNKLFGAVLGTMLIAGLALAVAPATPAHAEDNGNNNKERENTAHAVGSTLEVHIFDDGSVLVRGAKVTSVSGSVIYATTAWGSASMPWTVNTDGATEINRRFGGRSSVSEVSVGDYLSFRGNLVMTSAGLTVQAKIIKDWSVQRKNGSFIGKVSSVGTGTFVLASDEHGQATVSVTSTTVITKGDAAATFADIHVGDKVMAGGLFNNVSRVLDADKVKIYVDKASEQHVFEGTLKAIAGTGVPVSLTVTLNDTTDVTVNVPVGISVVGRLYLGASFADFHVGDKIRIWGLREGMKIDATVVRDVSLPR